MKVSSEQQEARFDLARVTAEITLKLGMAMDHDMNLSECYLLSRAEVQSLRETQAVLVEALKELVRCEDQIQNQGLMMYEFDKEIELKAAMDAADQAIARAEASKGEAA